MKHKLRFVATAVGIGSLAVAAQALTVTFNNGTLESGAAMSAYTPGGEGWTYIPSSGIHTGIEFHTVNDAINGAGFSNTVSFNYTVTADPGMKLTGMQVSPGMFLRDATGHIVFNTVAADRTYTNASTTLTGITEVPYAVALNTHSIIASGSYQIDTLSSLGANRRRASDLDFQVTYTEAPVPEPSALLALGFGGLGLFLRKRSK